MGTTGTLKMWVKVACEPSGNLVFLQVSQQNILKKLINTSAAEMFFPSQDCEKRKLFLRQTHHLFFFFFFSRRIPNIC